MNYVAKSYKCQSCKSIIIKGHLVDLCPVCKSRNIKEVKK